MIIALLLKIKVIIIAIVIIIEMAKILTVIYNKLVN